jgi:thiamine pyrophosphokinase
MAEHHTVIVTAGAGPSVVLHQPTTVIAADGGLDRAFALGLDVDLAVGDFDSASTEALADARARGVRIERHPTAKDATDLELALDAAVENGSTSVLVVGSAEGRLDHLVTGMLLLAAERYAALELDAQLGNSLIHVIRAERTLYGTPGELITLAALGGPAENVTTRGLVYPLTSEQLGPGSTRGVSNVFAERVATILVGEGVLLAIRPGPST